MFRKKFFLFRHGETNWNTDQIMTGQIDDERIFLTKQGISQALAIKDYILREKINIIISSDLNRARTTVHLIQSNNKIVVRYYKELRVLNMGNFQGIHKKDFVESKEVQLAFSNYDIKLPYGESINELNSRLFSILDCYSQNSIYTKIAVITHGICISSIVEKISGKPYTHYDYAILDFNNKYFISSVGLYK